MHPCGTKSSFTKSNEDPKWVRRWSFEMESFKPIFDLKVSEVAQTVYASNLFITLLVCHKATSIGDQTTLIVWYGKLFFSSMDYFIIQKLFKVARCLNCKHAITWSIQWPDSTASLKREFQFSCVRDYARTRNRLLFHHHHDRNRWILIRFRRSNFKRSVWLALLQIGIAKQRCSSSFFHPGSIALSDTVGCHNTTLTYKYVCHITSSIRSISVDHGTTLSGISS